jgi:hypothetical protein
LIAVGFSVAMARESHGVSPGQWAGVGVILFLVALFFIYKADQKR